MFECVSFFIKLNTDFSDESKERVKRRLEGLSHFYNYDPSRAAYERIADYLDLDKQRTPMLWFSIMGIEGFSKSEWETHFQISNEKKLKDYFDAMICGDVYSLFCELKQTKYN